jgi:hypothetical protein
MMAPQRPLEFSLDLCLHVSYLLRNRGGLERQEMLLPEMWENDNRIDCVSNTS